MHSTRYTVAPRQSAPRSPLPAPSLRPGRRMFSCINIYIPYIVFRLLISVSDRRAGESKYYNIGLPKPKFMSSCGNREPGRSSTASRDLHPHCMNSCDTAHAPFPSLEHCLPLSSSPFLLLSSSRVLRLTELLQDDFSSPTSPCISGRMALPSNTSPPK